MPTTVTSTIGSGGGRDYSSIASWEAATDNNLVLADEIQVGACYNDSEFTTAVTIDGATTDATRYRVLTAAAGQSFQDNANVRTTRLFYSQANGVGINVSTGFSDAVNIAEAYSRVERLQIKGNSTTTYAVRATAGNCRVTDSILEVNGNTREVFKASDSGAVLTNCALYQMEGGSPESLVFFFLGGTMINCTAACPSDLTPAAQGLRATYSTGSTITNCAFYGVTDIGTTSNVTYSNCYTDDATSLPSGVTNAAFNTTTGSGFEATVAASIDLRAKSSGVFDGAGTPTGAPVNDISGTARANPPTVGCWEIVAAGDILLGQAIL